jgi:Ni/Co efflux regulator RcnB
MRRLFSILFVVVALAGPMAGGAAHARDDERGDHGRGREARGAEFQDGRGYERRGYERRDDRGGRYEGPQPSYERRREDRGRYEGERGRMSRDYGPPPSAGPAFGYGPPAGRSVRRGGYMPPAFHGPALGDYGRYRLRSPPRGYAWYRVGGGYALVSLYTGQIFDMIPD